MKKLILVMALGFVASESQASREHVARVPPAGTYRFTCSAKEELARDNPYVKEHFTLMVSKESATLIADEKAFDSIEASAVRPQVYRVSGRDTCKDGADLIIENQLLEGSDGDIRLSSESCGMKNTYRCVF